MPNIIMPKPTLMVVDQIQYPDGTKFVSGIMTNAGESVNKIGIRVLDKIGSQTMVLDLSIDNALAMIRLLASAVQFTINNPNPSNIVVPLNTK